tara:strand:- start:944 stop:1096 length:153 start_codon:yes stop_codon:yes gene_type:complete
MNKDKNINLQSILIKNDRKKRAEQIVKDYLKPGCEETFSEEEYPEIKDYE